MRALVVGISKYRLPQGAELQSLQFAAKDASLFARYLATPRGASLAGLVPADVEVTLLPDERATKVRIENELRELDRKAKPGDTLVFFASAHGAVENRDGYIIPYSANPDQLLDSAFSLDTLTKWMYHSSRQGCHVIIFLDICHAARLQEIYLAEVQNREKNDTAARFQRLANDADSHVFGLLASNVDQLSWEHQNIGGGHGVFTYFLIRGMNPPATEIAQDWLNRGELKDYVEAMVMRATWRKQRPIAILRDEERRVARLRGAEGVAVPLKWEPIPKQFLSGSRGKPLAVPPDSGDDGPSIPPHVPLEEAGQQLLQRYLRGDEVPQQRDHFASGVDIYQRALALEPDSEYLRSRLHFFRGRTFTFDREYGHAIAELETSIRLDPGAAYAYNGLGLAYLAKADYPRAAASFGDAIRRAPYWTYPRHNLALVRLQLGDTDGAIASYRAAIDRAPFTSYLPYHLGMVLQKVNRRAEAVRMYSLAAGHASGNAAPLAALAALKADPELFRQALRMLEAYPAPDVLRATRHNFAVVLLEKRRDPSLTLELLRVNAAEDYLPSILLLARQLALGPAPADALPLYRRIRDTHPENVEIRLELAEVLLRAEGATAARAEISDALQILPGNAALKRKWKDLQQR